MSTDTHSRIGHPRFSACFVRLTAEIRLNMTVDQQSYPLKRGTSPVRRTCRCAIPVAEWGVIGRRLPWIENSVSSSTCEIRGCPNSWMCTRYSPRMPFPLGCFKSSWKKKIFYCVLDSNYRTADFSTLSINEFQFSNFWQIGHVPPPHDRTW